MNAPGAVCWICLGLALPDVEGAPYHRACLVRLFGAPVVPRLDFDRAAVIAWWGERSGKMSISGYQPKAPVRLAEDGAALEMVATNATYILKPQHGTYDSTPENEHLTMRLAELVGLPVAECGLFRLTDASVAYVTRRFDRLGIDLSQRLEHYDFCSLLERDPDDKDDGTAEECAARMRESVSDPEESSRKLFRQFVFAYWIGNGDMHLKNLALLCGTDDQWRLSPAYDLLCTDIYGQNTMTLSLRGQNQDFTRGDWLTFAERDCRIPREEARSILAEMASRLDPMLAMVARSPLPEAPFKEKMKQLLRLRGELLLRASTPPAPAAG